MSVKNPKEGIELYPLHKLIGLIDEEDNLHNAVKALKKEGFEGKDIHYYHGKEGLEVLDLYETHHGLLNKLIRKFQMFTSMEAEEGIKKVYESMHKGSYFITVFAEESGKKETALKIFRANNAYNIHYFDTMDVEIL